jgi:hypothetical protein
LGEGIPRKPDILHSNGGADTIQLDHVQGGIDFESDHLICCEEMRIRRKKACIQVEIQGIVLHVELMLRGIGAPERLEVIGVGRFPVGAEVGSLIGEVVLGENAKGCCNKQENEENVFHSH